MADRLWVAVLNISDRTAEKIQSVHGIDPNDVRDEIVCRAGLVGTWHDHPDRGRRAIIEGEIFGTKVLIVVYPLGDDVFNLGSAYPVR